MKMRVRTLKCFCVTDWSCLNNIGIEEPNQEFVDIIHEYTDIYAPLKTVHIQPKCILREPWMTKGLMKSSITLSKMHPTNSGKSLNQ